MGIAAGIAFKFILHWIRGVAWKEFFKAYYRIERTTNGIHFHIQGPAVFSNLLLFKSVLEKQNHDSPMIVDFDHCKFVDHTFLEFMAQFERERDLAGKPLFIRNLDQMQAVSDHKTSARRQRTKS